MRHLMIFVLLFVVTVCSSYANPVTVYEPPFSPQSAEIMGQGGSFNANGYGFYSLFSNPASFAFGKPSLTILSAMPWLYAFPSAAVIESLGDVVAEPASGISGLNDLLTGPGFGAGASLGLGYVGNGLGLGLVQVTDLFAKGPNTLGINVDSHLTVGFVSGFALPISIGPVTLNVGGAFRPMYRIRVPELGITGFTALLSDETGEVEIGAPVYHGVALALDMGTIASLGPFAVGIALRDLFGTSFRYSESTVTELKEALKVGALPEGGEIVSDDLRFIIPMTVHLGASFRPDLGALSNIIDPGIHANWEYPVIPGEEPASFWTTLHAGAEVAFFNRIRLRAGINQGYITAGMGVHLFMVNLNVAYFGRELGSFAGARQNQGITAELAFRF